MQRFTIKVLMRDFTNCRYQEVLLACAGRGHSRPSLPPTERETSRMTSSHTMTLNKLEKAPHDSAHVSTTPTSLHWHQPPVERGRQRVKGPLEVSLEMLSRAEKMCLIPTTLPQK